MEPFEKEDPLREAHRESARMEQLPVDQIKGSGIEGVTPAQGLAEIGKACQSAQLCWEMVSDRGRANDQADLTCRKERHQRK